MARILIGEDNEPVALAFMHYFRQAGHTPLLAPTGHGALRRARADPHVIVLDLGLPDLPPEEVLDRPRLQPYTQLTHQSCR